MRVEQSSALSHHHRSIMNGHHTNMMMDGWPISSYGDAIGSQNGIASRRPNGSPQPQPSSQLPLAMSFALPKSYESNRASKENETLFTLQRLGVSATRSERGLDLHKDSSNSGLGYTLKGATCFSLSTRSPPPSPIMSPIKSIGFMNPLATPSATQTETPSTPSVYLPRRASANSLREPSPLSITSVSLFPGHMATSFQGGRVFCVFDSVPDGHDLSEHDQERLRVFVRRTLQDGITKKDETFTPNSGGTMLALRTVDSIIVAMIFIPPTNTTVKPIQPQTNDNPFLATSAPLRLLVIQQNATFLIWEYVPTQSNNTTMHWLFVARGILPCPITVKVDPAAESVAKPSPSPPRFVVQAIYNPKFQTVTWFEKLTPVATTKASTSYTLFTTQLSPLSEPQLSDVFAASILRRTGYSSPVSSSAAVPTLWSTPYGFFITPLIHDRHQLSSLYYFSLQNHQLVRLNVLTTPTEEKSLASTAVFAIHPHSNQLYALDANRRLISFRDLILDANETNFNAYDASLYVQCTLETILTLPPIPPPTKPTRSQSKSRLSALAAAAPPTPPTNTFELLPGSRLAVFRQYLCLIQPTTNNSSFNAAFYTLLDGSHLSSIPFDPARESIENDSDESFKSLSILSTTHGFGSGIGLQTASGIWWIKIGHILSQVQAIARKKLSQQQPNENNNAVVSVSRTTRDLNKLITASDTLVPPVTGLLPPSVASSPIISSTNGTLPSLSSLDSPLITSSSSGLMDSLPPSQQSNYVCQLVAPFKDSVEPIYTKHHIGRVISKMAAKTAATASSPELPDSSPSTRLTHLRLGEENESNRSQGGELEEVKEGGDGGGGSGGGEGQQQQPYQQQVRKEEMKSHLKISPRITGENPLAPTDASWFPPIFRSLQSPALAVAIFHISTSMPNLFSQPTQPSNPSLITPAFTGHTFDANYERILREQVEQYLAMMTPISHHRTTHTNRGRRGSQQETSTPPMARTISTNSQPESEQSGNTSSASSSGTNTPRSLSPEPSVIGSAGNGTLTNTASVNQRASTKSCFQHYTSLSLQTRPFIQQYQRVMHQLRRMKHGNEINASIIKPIRKPLRESAGMVEGEETNSMSTTGETASTTSHIVVSSSSSHPAAYISPLPSLQQQFSKAITNRLTHLATTTSSLSSTTGDRSFTSLVIHDAQMTLQYLFNLLGLQGLHQQALAHQQQQQGDASATNSSSGSGSSLPAQRVLPNLLLVNEETKIRKDLLNSVGLGAAPEKEASSLIHYPSASSSSSTSGSNSLLNLGRLDTLPYFETLIRLLDELAPQLLVEFVRINDELFAANKRVSRSGASTPAFASSPKSATDLLTPLEMESHVERALRILPPILTMRHQRRRAQRSRAHPHETNETSSTLALEDDKKEDDQVEVDPVQQVAQQLRLDRITARCSLLVLSGRPLEAVLLRLKMAMEERDSSQEEAAITLANEIVQKQESEEYKRLKVARARSSGSMTSLVEIESKSDSTDLPLQLPASSPTHALRAELFHHLLTYWLQRQFHQQYAHARKLLSEDPSSAVTTFFPPLPTLDPRIGALIPPNFPVTTYFDVLTKEKLKFEQELQDKRDEEEQQKKQKAKEAAAVAAVAAVNPSASVSLPSSASAKLSAALEPTWPNSSPLLLPSPAMMEQRVTGVQVDLPMSCLLSELKRFAEMQR